MDLYLPNVTRLCFGASYLVALALELAQTVWPRNWPRLLGLIFGIAGLLAHTIFLLAHPRLAAEPHGSLLLLAWVVAVFYLYGAIHYRRLAWAIFVLPIVVLLIGLAEFFPASQASLPRWFSGAGFWGAVHGTLLLLAAIGVCVGCAASVMYLVQAWRLKTKSHPGHGLKLLSLERLAAMNRRAIVWAFPLLTAGLLVGAFLQIHEAKPIHEWLAARYLTTAGLWLTFLVLLYLRYGVHASNRRLAYLTIAAFGLLLVTLATSHPLPEGVSP
jgi:hypothetical protein